MSEWISVKTSLPPENKRVLIFNLRDSEYSFLDEIRIGFTQYGKWWLYKSYHGNSDDVDVTHWMPLPEAPVVSNTDFNLTQPAASQVKS